MATKQVWSAPELKVYGSVETMTEQIATVNKAAGTGDTITFVITVNGTTIPGSVTTNTAGSGSTVSIP
jgi:hypothetical protein